MSIILQGSTSGSITLQEPAVAGTNTVTIPARTGNIMLDGPTFFAYRVTTNQSISANTWTKVQLNAELFDTNSNFDSTTNYRFTPTVAGYYQINATILFSLSSGTAAVTLIGIYKNGTEYAVNECTATVANGHSTPISTLIYMNGTTDYIELYGLCSNATTSITWGPSISFMNGSLVRGA